jgi:hypothetical protein
VTGVRETPYASPGCASTRGAGRAGDGGDVTGHVRRCGRNGALGQWRCKGLAAVLAEAANPAWSNDRPDQRDHPPDGIGALLPLQIATVSAVRVCPNVEKIG